MSEIVPSFTASITRIDICLRCPRGCEVHTTTSGADGANAGIQSMTGNQCRLGLEYVTQEIRDPRRILPTTVRVRDGTKPLVSAWTPEPIPKSLLLELAAYTRTVTLDAPVHLGQVIVENWRGLGIRLVAGGEVGRSDTAR